MAQPRRTAHLTVLLIAALGTVLGCAADDFSDHELQSLTGGVGRRVDPRGLEAAVTIDEAEAVVRRRYPGDRPLVWRGLVEFRVASGPRVGWMIVLGLTPGGECSFNPGFLNRPLEGGIVDPATAEISWIYGCDL